ncbi:MAG: hypothetical protein ISR65_12425 [Bacteriovoracaceae bacterium]|nr:hypothetical protein [Bacteriovoracaceae bacterium]
MLDAIVVLLYFTLIVGVGVWVGKFSKTTSDFFFGGRRFSWWLVGMSCVATLVGSYSFIQYSQLGVNYGMSSMAAYTNDWYMLPIFILAWLPIIYYNNIKSVPEYFERRFNRTVRQMVIVMLLIYLIGYIGINLLTIGVAMKSIVAGNPLLQTIFGVRVFEKMWSMGGLLDWNLLVPAIVIAILSGLYLHAGGQTSVIITDLLQGFLLLAVGLSVVVIGIYYVGGFSTFWSGLPTAHKLPFSGFNEPAKYSAVGVFWADGIIGSVSFYCINQGMLMRFLSARSVHDGRKAIIFVIALLMPFAAIAVGGVGWVGKILVDTGALEIASSKEVFIRVAQLICAPGIYGFVVAAVIAALMSTLDTLIAAASAIVVNDIVRPAFPGKEDGYYLKQAKRISLVITAFGIFLIPVFDQFNSIFRALTHFTAMVMPPLVVVTLVSIFFKKFSSRGAFWTLIIGSAALLLSVFFPVLVKPIAQGIQSESFSMMRSLFGAIVSAIVAMIFLIFNQDKDTLEKDLTGLTMHTIDEAAIQYSGGSAKSVDKLAFSSDALSYEVDWKDAYKDIHLSNSVMEKLGVETGDLVFITDERWWLGGLRSTHAILSDPHDQADNMVIISKEIFDRGNFLPDCKLKIENAI